MLISRIISLKNKHEDIKDPLPHATDFFRRSKEMVFSRPLKIFQMSQFVSGHLLFTSASQLSAMTFARFTVAVVGQCWFIAKPVYTHS